MTSELSATNATEHGKNWEVGLGDNAMAEILQLK
jgi:hypothetical protein